MEKNKELIPANKSEQKEIYEAPVIETVEVRVEQGFQASALSSPGDIDSNEYTW